MGHLQTFSLSVSMLIGSPFSDTAGSGNTNGSILSPILDPESPEYDDEYSVGSRCLSLLFGRVGLALPAKPKR